MVASSFTGSKIRTLEWLGTADSGQVAGRPLVTHMARLSRKPEGEPLTTRPDLTPVGAADREFVPCALCGGQDFVSLYTGCLDRLHPLPGRFDVLRCSGCGLAQTNPRPTRAGVQRYYPSSYAPFTQREFRRGRLFRLLRWLAWLPYPLRYGPEQAVSASAQPCGRVLDVGCGSGVLLAELAQLGWEVWGIEPDRRTAHAVTADLDLPADRIFDGTAEEANFPAASFDLVTMSHVLEHIHDPAAVLAKVHGWLRPDGVLRVWVPNIASPESRFFRRWWHGLDVPRHLYHFDKPSLSTMLVENGFRVERLVPQCQGSTLSSSLQHVASAMVGGRRAFRHSRFLYLVTLPVASVLLGLGNDAYLDATARRR